MFQGLKQVSRVRDDVVRKVPGQGHKGTEKPTVYLKGLKSFKPQLVNICGECFLVEGGLTGTLRLCGCPDLRWWPGLG